MLLLLLLFGLVGGAIGLLGYAAVAQLVSLVQNWSGLLDSLQSTMDQMEELFSNLWALVPIQITDFITGTFNSLFEWFKEAASDWLTSFGSTVGEKAMGFPSFVIALVIYIMATYLLTADYPYLRSRAGPDNGR